MIICLKIDFSDVMLIGFSLKLDGWIFASVVAEKNKKDKS